MIRHKEMKKLYRGKYQHKVVLVLKGAFLFRNRSLDSLAEIAEGNLDSYNGDFRVISELANTLQKIENFTVRVERCYLSIYLTCKEHVDWISQVGGSHVKEIYDPPVNLVEGSIVSRLPYDYKVNIKVDPTIDYEGFLVWANSNSNIRLPGSTSYSLKVNSKMYPHVYFYVTGEKHLTLAKMHLGSGIKTVEKIINP